MENLQTNLNVHQGADIFENSWTGHWKVIGGNNPGPGPNPNSGPPNGGSSGLSGGAIAGIVVGAVAVIAIIAAIIAFVLIRKKRRAKRTTADPSAPQGAPSYADKPYGQQPYDAQPYYSDRPHELQSNNFDRRELDGQGYYKPDNNKPQNYYELPERRHLQVQPAHELPDSPRLT